MNFSYNIIKLILIFPKEETMEQSLSQYRIFYEVARLGNISKAAKELYISQPAISKAISRLEGNLDISLFTRNSRGVQLTLEGQMLYEHTKTAFDSLNRGEMELKRIKEFNIGFIRIGVSNTLCKYILLDYLKGFVEKYPHIKVTIDSQSTNHTITMLEQQHIDLGLIAEPKGKRNLTFIPIMDIEDIFVATPNYLANYRLREGDADIFQIGNIMMLDSDNVTRHHVDNYLLEHHIEINQVIEVTTMDLLIEFAKIGLGIGCVIKEFVQKELNNGTLVEIPLEVSINKRTIGLAHHSSARSSALTAFLEFCNKSQ